MVIISHDAYEGRRSGAKPVFNAYKILHTTATLAREWTETSTPAVDDHRHHWPRPPDTRTVMSTDPDAPDACCCLCRVELVASSVSATTVVMLVCHRRPMFIC